MSSSLPTRVLLRPSSLLSNLGSSSAAGVATAAVAAAAVAAVADMRATASAVRCGAVAFIARFAVDFRAFSLRATVATTLAGAGRFSVNAGAIKEAGVLLPAAVANMVVLAAAVLFAAQLCRPTRLGVITSLLLCGRSATAVAPGVLLLHLCSDTFVSISYHSPMTFASTRMSIASLSGPCFSRTAVLIILLPCFPALPHRRSSFACCYF